MLTDQDEFFAMKKPSIDDTLDEQTIRQILSDKRRELELPIRGPKGMINTDIAQSVLWKAC